MVNDTRESTNGEDSTEIFDDQLTRVNGKLRPTDEKRDALSVPRLFVGKQESPQSRYELRKVLGKGVSGQVFQAWDKDLNREIAIKIIRDATSEERESFLFEAHVSAILGHPNIPPIYDAGETYGGTLYLTMRRVPGRSLGELIRKAVHERRSEAMPLESAIEVMLKLCDAVAYVHSRGIIHQDIKPDNIVLGEFGEVMLIDWGAAAVVANETNPPSTVMGTPAYMAPERFRGEAPNPSFDIYAIGVTLFYLVLLRKPLLETNESRFWSRKRAGELDLPTAEELVRGPRPLIGIALKAMSAAPNDRYSSVAELAQAIRDFHARRSVWAAPVVVETFADDTYLERWGNVFPGDFCRQRGRLIGQCELGGLLLYKSRLPAGVAIEFDGEILDGHLPGDLSVIWADDNLLENPHWPENENVWSLQIGAFSNLMVGIYRGMTECVAGRPRAIEVGRKYRIRAEINERSLRLLLDGEVVAEYADLYPINSGYLGIYTYYPGKAISNLKLYELGFAEQISPTAIGDAFFACGDYVHAAEHYARVAQLLPKTPLADEANYKRGTALLRAGDAQASGKIWQELRDETWRARANLHRTDSAFDAGLHDEVLESIGATLQRIPALRTTVINRWVTYVTKLCNSNISALPRYLELREKQFSDHIESASAAAAAEVALGHWSDVLTRFPEHHIPFKDACNLLGKFDVVADRYSKIAWISDFARLRMDCSKSQNVSGQFVYLARLLQGDIEGALEACRWPEILLVAGRFEDMLRLERIAPEEKAAALRNLGRVDEAVALRDARSLALVDAGPEVFSESFRLSEQLYLLHHLAFRAFVTGDENQYRYYRKRAAALPCGAIWGDVWMHRHVLIPLVDELLHDAGAFERGLRAGIAEHSHKWYAALAYLARFVLGELSEEQFASQPYQLFIRSRTILARALRAEFIQERDLARACYAQYLALPKLERVSDSAWGDPVVDRWVRFRAAEASG